MTGHTSHHDCPACRPPYDWRDAPEYADPQPEHRLADVVHTEDARLKALFGQVPTQRDAQ